MNDTGHSDATATAVPRRTTAWARLLATSLRLLRPHHGSGSARVRREGLAARTACAAALLLVSSASSCDVPPTAAANTAKVTAPLALEPASLLTAQPARIDAAIAKFERPAELDAAGFFVGFAGFGEQRVFASEIALAARVLGERFPIGTRTIQLVNDRRDTTRHPLASPTTLRYTLAQVARRMRLDRDVLFLALSSHGTADGVLEVSNEPLPLDNLSVAELASALDDSGIQWRVIVVSACFSGQFIAPLANERTIVITAAAADRSSFGCADDRDLTYFGEAFYRDILPTAPTLRTAFTRMKAAIAAREKREEKKPSRPQAHFGKAMENYLIDLSRPRM